MGKLSYFFYALIILIGANSLTGLLADPYSRTSSRSWGNSSGVWTGSGSGWSGGGGGGHK